MALNIKNPETEMLVHQLADLTGESLTEAVTTAVQERIQRVGAQKNKPTFEEIRALCKEITAHLGPITQDEINDMLYDERGLPR